MSEKEFETWLCTELRAGSGNPDRLAHLSLNPRDDSIPHMGALLGSSDFDLFQDTSDWNTHPRLMQDVIGGSTPDIVLRSKSSGENRILIEVKLGARLGYGVNDSQILRYFLHLLTTSKQSAGTDIPRAVILAAPRAWFVDAYNARTWAHFNTNYGGLARHFGITLAALYAPPQFD